MKSAALSSNQAVGVKKSLRFEVQVLQTLNRALYEDFFFKFVEFFFCLYEDLGLASPFAPIGPKLGRTKWSS